MAAISTALIALQAAQTVGSFVGQRRAATGAEAQGNYEAGVAEQNATLAEQAARDAVVRGAEAEHRHRRGVKGLIGSQRAALAASGVDVGSGSAAGVQADSAALGELDALTIRNNARREAYGFQVEAANDRSRAGMARAAGRNAAAGLRTQAWGTLLNGALQTYGMAKDAGLVGRSGPRVPKVPKGTAVPSGRALPAGQAYG